MLPVKWTQLLSSMNSLHAGINNNNTTSVLRSVFFFFAFSTKTSLTLQTRTIFFHSSAFESSVWFHKPDIQITRIVAVCFSSCLQSIKSNIFSPFHHISTCAANWIPAVSPRDWFSYPALPSTSVTVGRDLGPVEILFFWSRASSAARPWLRCRPAFSIEDRAHSRTTACLFSPKQTWLLNFSRMNWITLESAQLITCCLLKSQMFSSEVERVCLKKKKKQHPLSSLK